MVHFIKATVLLAMLYLAMPVAYAQSCKYTISGKVRDMQQQPVPGVIVHLVNDSAGAVTDTAGVFSMAMVCPGMHKISFEALGYKEISVTVEVDSNKRLDVDLPSADNELGLVMVNGEKVRDLSTVTYAELKDVALMQTRGESLGDALKELPGLNAVQTGPTLSKPVIHGLHSNRVLIINNGVRQEGQQWGSEHAPEIDPFIANKITVIKGAASVRYGSDAIGGVVLLSPDEINTRKSISGDVYLVGASNGQMGVISASLQGSLDRLIKGLSWRVQGTLKEAGNFHTPRYYLINTGLHEGDFSAELNYKHKALELDAFYSQYNTEVGIFTGAESGNVTELIQKFSLPTPGLPSYFTYNIDRPYQVVYHDLIKAKASYKLDNNDKVELTFGRQNDIRKEYDDLSVTTNPAAASMPQLSFQLITHTIDLVYTEHAKNGFSGSFGVSGSTSGNVFEGVRYLIPNFRDYNGGAFAIEKYDFKKFTFEAGLRYDYRWLCVYQRNQTTLELYNTTYTYSNASGTVGTTYHYNDHLSANLNVGTAWRAPSINEMYINGEHFSDASYEVGDSSLKSERSVNTSLSVNYTGDKLRAVVDLYYNSIDNYIYEKPALKYRQLASGTFPEFDYTQANVNIKGIDAMVQYDFLPQFTLESKTTIVRGYNEDIHNWLISMPCDRFENGVSWHLPKLGKFKEPYLTLSNVSVLKQTRVPPNSDYVPPPSGYVLYNANAGFTIAIKQNTLNVNLSANNITNVAYRDYLDHFRYYSDELGVNYVLRLKYSF